MQLHCEGKNYAKKRIKYARYANNMFHGLWLMIMEVISEDWCVGYLEQVANFIQSEEHPITHTHEIGKSYYPSV